MVLWLSGLHIPETYLAALVQIACRRNNWPLDRSTLYTAVTEFTDPLDIEERPEPVSLFVAFLRAFIALLGRQVALVAYAYFSSLLER